MSILQALLLGIVQGATEFLPISSSAHLVLVPWLLGWHPDPEIAVAFDVMLHWGTLLAVLVFFGRDLAALLSAALRGILRRRPFEEPLARVAWLTLAASVPAALFGMLFEDQIASVFQKPAIVSALLLLTAAFLALSERLGKRTREMTSLRLPDAVWIGLAQALALFPGISRSGSTIAAGMSVGLRRRDAARFSFLMAVPVMIGAGIVSLPDLLITPQARAYLWPLVVGFSSAALIGYLAIRWLLDYLARRPLTPFAIYCALAGVAGIVVSFLRG